MSSAGRIERVGNGPHQGTTESARPSLLEMYQLPDNPPLTDRDMASTIERNEKLLQKLPQLIRESLQSSNMLIRLAATRVIREVPDETEREQLQQQVTPLLREAMHDQDWEVRMEAVNAIGDAPAAERVSLIKAGWQDEDWSVKSRAGFMIREAPEEEIGKLIKEGLAQEAETIQVQAAEAIGRAPLEERGKLIRNALASDNSKIGFTAAQFINETPEEEQQLLQQKLIFLINRTLSDPDRSVATRAVRAISYAPEAEQGMLAKEAFAHTEVSVLFAAASFINSVPEGDQLQFRQKLVPLIQEGLSTRDGSGASRVIKHAPLAEMRSLITQALHHKRETVRLLAAQAIRCAPEEQRLALVTEALQDTERSVRLAAAQALLPEELKIRFPDVYHDLQIFARTTSFYDHIEDPDFYRHDYSPLEDKMVLLGKVPGRDDVSLKNRAIWRKMPLHSYFTWLEAYAAAPTWLEKGFEYVPIEPIIKTGMPKLTDDVYARVLLGPNVSDWLENGGYYEKEIEESMAKIRETLIELGIDHGHLHNDNFVVVFANDADGRADLSHPPRVYAIDFDMAEKVTVKPA